jgi:hypothetical protein
VISEGFYIGSTQSQPQHEIRGFEIFNNRVLRTGTEAFQIGQVGEGTTRIYNNVFGPSAVDWRDAFQNFQDGNLQMHVRGGRLEVFGNIFIGGAGKWAEILGTADTPTSKAEGDGVFLERNYFSHARNLGMYIHDRDMRPMVYRIAGNLFRAWNFNYDELHPSSQHPGHLIRVAGNDTPIEVIDNVWEAPEVFTNRLADGNGAERNMSGSGNTRRAIEPVIFRDAGVPADFDYFKLEVWTATARRANDVPVEYKLDDIVTHYSGVYRCKLDPCPAGRVPLEHPEVWESLPPFPDDVRLHADSPHDWVGLKPER